MARTTTPSTSFTPQRKWWSLTLTAMTPGKLLCLQHVLEASFQEVPTHRPSRPAPKFVQGPTGHPSYVVLTCLTGGALRTLKGALMDYQGAFIKRMGEAKVEQERKKTENPRALYPMLPDRHMLVDEFLDFLQPLPEPEASEDPRDGSQMLLQVLKLSESP